ncbi:MAG: YdeI/OmpD-associated family protein [Bacteroidota bacterium]
MVIPDYFTKALSKNKKAWTVFENFSYSNKKEYVEWAKEAKTESTQQKRLDTAIEWISEGKIRNWKYLKPKE